MLNIKFPALAKHNGALVALAKPLILVLNGVHHSHQLWEVHQRLHGDGESVGADVDVADLQEQPLIRDRAIPVGLQVDLQARDTPSAFPAAHAPSHMSRPEQDCAPQPLQELCNVCCHTAPALGTHAECELKADLVCLIAHVLVTAPQQEACP